MAVDFYDQLLSDRREVTIAGRRIGDGQPMFFIGEIGINHNGSVETARSLIDMAAAAGCEAVKFQKRTVDVVYTKEELERPRESPFGTTNGDLKRGLEFGLEQYREIDRYCREKRILWFASCWDEGSVDFMEQFDVPCYKIASASLTDASLLRRTRATGKPIILSTGMSSFEEIERAMEILGEKDTIILHCTSTYPCEPDEINLRVMLRLRERFRCPIGYSGHEVGILPSVMAAVLGAGVIERHVTLDRAMWGTDQAASLEIPGLNRLLRDISLVPKVLGDGLKRRYASEEPILKKLRRVDSLAGKELE